MGGPIYSIHHTSGDIFQNETTQTDEWINTFNQKLAGNQNISAPPLLFIDPVADVFVDPCYSKYKEPEKGEREAFIKYTNKYVKRLRHKKLPTQHVHVILILK